MNRSLVLATLVTALVGCGTASQPATPLSTTPASSASRAATPLVGTWSRITTCEERASALAKAGLERFTLEHAAGEGWLPGVTETGQILDPRHPCTGAVPLRHEHFFTVDGLFGSRDADGRQVDDGTYRVVDDRTVVINDGTFRYSITGGDTLRLDPVMPDCAATGCFAAQWAVAVAYPGLTWNRTA